MAPRLCVNSLCWVSPSSHIACTVQHHIKFWKGQRIQQLEWFSKPIVLQESRVFIVRIIKKCLSVSIHYVFFKVHWGSDRVSEGVARCDYALCLSAVTINEDGSGWCYCCVLSGRSTFLSCFFALRHAQVHADPPEARDLRNPLTLFN